MNIEKHLKSINWIFFFKWAFWKVEATKLKKKKKRALKWAHCQRKLLLSMWKTKRNPFHFETFPYLVLVSPCYFTYPEYINLYIYTRSMKFPLEPTSKNLQCFFCVENFKTINQIHTPFNTVSSCSQEKKWFRSIT